MALGLCVKEFGRGQSPWQTRPGYEGSEGRRPQSSTPHDARMARKRKRRTRTTSALSASSNKNNAQSHCFSNSPILEFSSSPNSSPECRRRRASNARLSAARRLQKLQRCGSVLHSTPFMRKTLAKECCRGESLLAPFLRPS